MSPLSSIAVSTMPQAWRRAWNCGFSGIFSSKALPFAFIPPPTSSQVGFRTVVRRAISSDAAPTYGLKRFRSTVVASNGVGE